MTTSTLSNTLTTCSGAWPRSASDSGKRRSGELEGSLEDANALVELMQGLPEGYELRARALRELHRTSEAILELEMALVIVRQSDDARAYRLSADLASWYGGQGEFEKGLAIDLRLIGICPAEPTFHYNLACSYALLEKPDDALDALRQAIERGYDDWEHLERDEDLENLRKLETFRILVATARGESEV